MDSLSPYDRYTFWRMSAETYLQCMATSMTMQSYPMILKAIIQKIDE